MEWSGFFAVNSFIDIAVQKISSINTHKTFVKWGGTTSECVVGRYQSISLKLFKN